jgi:hypothetical protein
LRGIQNPVTNEGAEINPGRRLRRRRTHRGPGCILAGYSASSAERKSFTYRLRLIVPFLECRRSLIGWSGLVTVKLRDEQKMSLRQEKETTSNRAQEPTIQEIRHSPLF